MVLFLILSLVIHPLFFQDSSATQPTPATTQQTIGVRTNEVLLDVLVHDKKGKIIRDLKPEEIEIFEDGVKQPVNSFRFIDSAPTEYGKPVKSGDRSSDGGLSPTISLDQANLVTLVFDQQDALRFQTARQVATTFMDTALRPNTLVRVFVIGRKLYLIEQFTSDRNKIAKAVEKALGTSEKAFREISGRNVSDLAALAEKAVASAGSLPSANNGPVELRTGEEATTEAVLTRLTLDTMLQSDKLLDEVGVPSPVFPLLSIARNHRKLAGRKMVFYVSNGLYLPNTGLSEMLRNVVSEANQANLTFYAVNTRQTLANTGNVNSRLETATVINATQRPETGTVGARDPFSSFQGRYAGGTAAADPRSAFTAFEVRRREQELNKKGPLTELTESTGGAVIQNVNDITTVIKQAVAELGIYYAISYTPTKTELDGKFRQITVKLMRSGVKALTRNGYFAVPASTGKPALTFESPMLAALNNTVVPHDFNYRVATLHFAFRPQERNEVLMIEAPLAVLLHNEDKEKKVYPVNFAILALVKNAKGEILQKFSDLYQLEIPTAQIEDAKKASAYLVRHFWLPPGDYLLESVIHDQQGNRLSANRRPFNVATAASGVKTGSLYLVKQIDPVEADSIESENPLFVNKHKITPEISASVSALAREDIPFHLSIYPDPSLAAPPTLSIELLHEGKVVATTTPSLPKPEENGAITFAAGIPTKGLASGNYRLRAQVKQGNTTAEEALSFEVTGTLAAKETDDGVKAITSTLAGPTDQAKELRLVALNTAKTVEISPQSLIEEIQKTGAAMHQRLGEYTYSLRKVRRQFDKKARLRNEEYKDYEAYPVKGQHALVQINDNGSRLSVDRIELDRKQATEALIKNEEEKQKANSAGRNTATQPTGYWGAGIEGTVQGKYAYITVNPAHFFEFCEFSAPRVVALDGRETIVLDYRPRPGIQIPVEKDWVQRMEGTIWIDVADNVLVRIEGQARPDAINKTIPVSNAPNFVYQQQRLNAGLWAPALIRINSAGDGTLFRGLNYDAWVEFANFRRFDSSESDVKLQAPTEKKGNQ